MIEPEKLILHRQKGKILYLITEYNKLFNFQMTKARRVLTNDWSISQVEIIHVDWMDETSKNFACSCWDKRNGKGDIKKHLKHPRKQCW